jgi:hypothetical protein
VRGLSLWFIGALELGYPGLLNPYEARIDDLVYLESGVFGITDEWKG